MKCITGIAFKKLYQTYKISLMSLITVTVSELVFAEEIIFNNN